MWVRTGQNGMRALKTFLAFRAGRMSQRFARGLVVALVWALVIVGSSVVVGVSLASAAVAAPTITGFSASPSSLASGGGSVTLSASVSGATSCVLSSSPSISGLVSQVACASGSVSVAVTVPADTTSTAKSYTFTLAATGSKTTKATATVAVAAQPAPVVSSFTASVATLPQTGGSVVLSATVTEATSCVFSSTPAVTGLPSTVSCTSGSASVSVTVPANTTTATKTYTFALSAKGSTTVKASPVTVTVAGVAAAVTSFTATSHGAAIDLAAKVTGATSCAFSVTPTVSGLPKTVTCSGGSATATVTVPANKGSAPIAYTFTLTATGTSSTATKTATVFVGPALTSIALAPADSTLTVGGTQQYVVDGYVGNTLVGEYTGGFTLTLTPDAENYPQPAGTTYSCSDSSLPTCTSTWAGDFAVSASGDGLTTTTDGDADLTVDPGPVASLTIDPTTDQVEAGEDEVYDVEGFDEYMNPIDAGLNAADPPLGLPDVALSIDAAAGTNPSDGVCNGLDCYAFDAGVYTVVASDGDISSPPATLTVVPSDPVSLTVTPNTSTITAGTNTSSGSVNVQDYTISGADKYGNEIPSITDGVSLYINDGDDVCNDADDTTFWCASDAVGTWTVTATVTTDDDDGTETTATGYAQLTVNPGSIQLTSPDATFPAGYDEPFAVEAFDSQGNDIGPLDNGFELLSINTPSGSCNAVSMTCTVEAIGTFTVTATYGTAAPVTEKVTVVPAGLQVTPGTSSIAAGSPQGYTVTALDINENPVGPDPNAILSIDTTPDIGSCVADVCTASVPGVYSVTAKDGAADPGMATLTVTAGTITQGAPTSGSTTPGNSTGFTDQLATTGQTGPVTFKTTTSATGIAVSASGAISVSTQLNAGAYTVSGTDSDTSGDTGTWSYTLTVAGGTITQGAPTSGSTTPGNSTGFTDQLATTGQTGPVTFVTTVPAAGIAVSASGAISVSTQLNTGTYPISGTDSDTNGDTGTWSYTLTVTPPNCSNIPTPPAELYAADFAYADLIGCDLQDANLRYANLNDADLEDSNFTGADLQQANLVNAPLNGADLQDANLFEADLQDANLYAANLTGANVLEVVWGDTTCPDGTNSNADLGTCANHLGQP